MLARVTTFTIAGLDPRRVTVEVDVRAGLPNFTIVGLGDRAVREARERVHAAILNSGFEFPRGASPSTSRRRTCARPGPASTSRSPSASSPPAARSRRARSSASRSSASSRSAASCGRAAASLAVAEGAGATGLEGLVVPRERAAEAALVDGLDVIAAGTLAEVADVLRGGDRPPTARAGARGAHAAPRRTPTSPTSAATSTSSAR